MKKVLLVFALLVLSSQLVLSQSTCVSVCKEQKEISAKEILTLRGDLASCKASFLSCAHETNDYNGCRENHHSCKYSLQQEIKDKTVLLNNQYKVCTSNCGPVPEARPAEVVNLSASSICTRLFDIREVMVQSFTQEELTKVLSLNKCPLWQTL